MATTTLVGTVGSDAVAIGSGPNRGAKFRMVSNRRRFDRATETWVNASEYWVEVTCWGRLGEGVAAGIRRGDPVLVAGHMESTSWTVDGVTHFRDRLVASAVGHDLSRGTGTFERTRAADAGSAAGASTGEESGDPAEPTEGGVDDLVGAGATG